MSLFPSERARQKSDRRTVRFLFKIIAFALFAYAALLTIHDVWDWL